MKRLLFSLVPNGGWILKWHCNIPHFVCLSNGTFQHLYKQHNPVLQLALIHNPTKDINALEISHCKGRRMLPITLGAAVYLWLYTVRIASPYWQQPWHAWYGPDTSFDSHECVGLGITHYLLGWLWWIAHVCSLKWCIVILKHVFGRLFLFLIQPKQFKQILDILRFGLIFVIYVWDLICGVLFICVVYILRNTKLKTH